MDQIASLPGMDRAGNGVSTPQMKWTNPFVSLAGVALGSRLAPRLDQAIISGIGTMLRPVRAWAAAELAEGDLDKLRHILGLESDAARYGSRALLKHMHTVSARAELARLGWQSALFGPPIDDIPGRNNLNASPLAAVTAEAMRHRAERSLHRMKPFFLPFTAAPMSAVGGPPATLAEAARLLGHMTQRPPIDRDVVNTLSLQRSLAIANQPKGPKQRAGTAGSPYDFQSLFDSNLRQFDAALADIKPISAKGGRKQPTHFPIVTSWLRWPAADGYGYARVIEPMLSGHTSDFIDTDQLASDIPAIVICHGLGVEYETAGPPINFALTLARRGLRVVLAEFAGHGKRRKPGLYGGEAFMRGQPVVGVLHLLEASAEAARLVAWCRAQGSRSVALAGSSLGALTAQLAACRAAETPDGQVYLPDQLLLVTPTGNLASLAFSSSMARAAGLDAIVAAAGWSEASFSPYAALVEPSITPPIDPAAISMVLGTDDTVTPYADGLALAQAWQIPESNLVIAGRGHFTSSIAMVLPGSALDKLAGALLSAHNA
jgi:pimeloyl-ACP methyl ester carboxylesterase